MNKVKIMKVEWVDICEVPGWISGHKEIRLAAAQELPEPLHCTDVGFLVEESKNAVWLSKTYAFGDDGIRWGGCVVIPKGCIKDKQVLEEIETRTR